MNPHLYRFLFALGLVVMVLTAILLLHVARLI